MNKGRLIGGIICLAIAALLTVLNFTLDADSLMFQVGDQNMPFVPPVVLGIVGIVLVVTAFTGKTDEEVKEEEREIVIDEEKSALNKRLEGIAWGLFLIMLGGFMLVPHDVIAKGTWSIG